jgi:3-hydroxybutyryl-CoA dehydrogenase
MQVNLENINKIAVIGAGGMGSGIAELLSRIGGYRVSLMDTTEELARRGWDNQKSNLQRFYVAKGKLTAEQADEILGRITPTGSMADAVRDADVIIEAVFENMDLKKKVFKQLDELAQPQAIFASNTSFQSVTELAAQTRRAPQVAGMHFFNPVAVMKLVEVVRAALTAEETSRTIYELAKKLGKEPVYCRDTYGFLANRAVRGRNDAVELVWAHLATPEDVDKAVKLGYNHPMGPLELADMNGGWNLMVTAEDDTIKEFGWDRGHVHTMIKMMVRAGYTGGQGKKGIYAFWNEVASKW